MFIRKASRGRALDRAVSCVLYVATLLKAQNGFRMACKKLSSAVSLLGARRGSIAPL